MSKRTKDGEYIGTSPAGVKWVCYWDSESKCEKMRSALVGHWRRKERVRVRNLTDTQVDHLYWANELYREGEGIPEGVVDYGKTYVEAPVDMMLAAWFRLEGDIEDVDIDPMEVGSPYRAASEAQIEFAYRAKKKSLEATVRKLEAACEKYLA